MRSAVARRNASASGTSAGSSASQLSTVAAVTSAWNWIPSALPSRNACVVTVLRASSVAPAGTS